MTYRVEEKKWILYRHINSFDMIIELATQLKRFSKTMISEEEKLRLLLRLKELNHYKGRNPEMPLDSINHRINTLAYYMFGYKEYSHGKKRFLFSPLGNLFIKHLGDSSKVSKIFFTMLWGIQFEHPHGGTDPSFKIYPFRLLFKLLTDKRLNCRLYAYEVSALLVFVNSIDVETYESLVDDILELRAQSNSDIQDIFYRNKHVLVNAAYEWDYYVSKLLQSAGVLNRVEGELICKIQHGDSSKHKTLRKITRNYVEISENVLSLCFRLLDGYPYHDEPLRLDDQETLEIDVIKRIYSFFPGELLEEINENVSNIQKALLDLPKLIEQYADNDEIDSSTKFEKILVDGFNVFYNVEAKHIGGAGKTDIECLYLTLKKKFAVDAKSTQDKIKSLSAGRLRLHREKIGGVYTIVVTPRYVPAVLEDIKEQPIVIIRASTFSEYLYNCIANDVRDTDYRHFDGIIEENLGEDVSPHISELTMEQFGVETLQQQ